MCRDVRPVLAVGKQSREEWPGAGSQVLLLARSSQLVRKPPFQRTLTEKTQGGARLSVRPNPFPRARTLRRQRASAARPPAPAPAGLRLAARAGDALGRHRGRLPRLQLERPEQRAARRAAAAGEAAARAERVRGPHTGGLFGDGRCVEGLGVQSHSRLELGTA